MRFKFYFVYFSGFQDGTGINICIQSSMFNCKSQALLLLNTQTLANDLIERAEDNRNVILFLNMIKRFKI